MFNKFKIGLIVSVIMSSIPISCGEKETAKKIEATFTLPVPAGQNPFDYTTFSVNVILSTPSGQVEVPAFYDGGQNDDRSVALAPFTWKMRFAPRSKGDYSVLGVMVNGVDQGIIPTPSNWTITCPINNFITVDKDKRHYRFTNNKPYYPIGHNHGDARTPFGDPASPASGDVNFILEDFVEMGKTGQNWSRVFMDPYFGPEAGLDLDWTYACPDVTPGYIDLGVAGSWDQIIDSAEQNGIYVQMVLNDFALWNSLFEDQNWVENPWNAHNTRPTGCAPFGFLDSASDFFTDPQAIEYTLRKVFYIVARWGYSPNVMSFETFDEIDLSDYFILVNNVGVLTQWNQSIIDLIHTYDFNNHLITDSVGGGLYAWPDSSIVQQMDTFQLHVYQPNDTDLIQYFSQVPPLSNFLIPRNSNRPIQIAEFGPQDVSDLPDLSVLADMIHTVLWTSAMRFDLPADSWYGAADYHLSGPPGSSLYAGINDIIGNFALFAHLSGMDKNFNFHNVDMKVKTKQLYDLTITTPFNEVFGVDNSNVVNSYPYNFVVTKEGVSPTYAFSNPFLQGPYPYPTVYHEVGFNPIFQFCNDAPFQAIISLSSVNNGAILQLILDGQVTEYTNLSTSILYTINIPAGKHTLSITNGGTTVNTQGNVSPVIGYITFTNYVYGLACVSRATNTTFVSWIYKRATVTDAIGGLLQLPKLKPGCYQAVWYNTTTGETQKQTIKVTGRDQYITVPSVDTDIALYMNRIS